eukprot:6201982-Pleurochrysis_carterae.AAC.1
MCLLGVCFMKTTTSVLMYILRRECSVPSCEPWDHGSGCAQSNETGLYLALLNVKEVVHFLGDSDISY